MPLDAIPKTRVFRRPSFLRIISGALLFAILLTSCRRASGPIAQEQTNLSWLASMYGMYIAQHQGRAPKNLDELHKFVEQSTTADQLARLKVANVNELFVSPRDGKPFALVSYDKMPALKGGEPPPVVLYEAQGQNGKRAIAYVSGGTGGTRTVDEQEFQKMLPVQAKVTR